MSKTLENDFPEFLFQLRVTPRIYAQMVLDEKRDVKDEIESLIGVIRQFTTERYITYADVTDNIRRCTEAINYLIAIQWWGIIDVPIEDD